MSEPGLSDTPHGNEIPSGDTDRQVILFLHGFLGCGADWTEVADRLKPGYHCLCPDLPGHGETPERTGHVTQQAAAALINHLDALHVDRCAIVGYSMGGRLALFLAIDYPERFSRIVLESASPGLKTEQERKRRIEHDEALAQQLEAIGSDKAAFRVFLEDWYTSPLFTSLDKHPERRAKLIASRLANDPARLADALRGLGVGAQPSLWERLEDLGAPTLLLVGDLDRKYRIVAEEMSERSPMIAMRPLMNCGHNVHFENPKGYTTVLKSFLEAGHREA